MRVRSGHATGDLFAAAHGNHAPRERLAMEMKSKPALQAAATRRLAHTHGPVTSKVAARKVSGTLNAKQAKVEAFAKGRARGFIQKDLEALGGKYASYRARCRELWVLGRMAPTGEEREDSEVWLHADFWTDPLPPVPQSRNERLTAAARALLDRCDRHAYEMVEPLFLAEREALRKLL